MLTWPIGQAGMKLSQNLLAGLANSIWAAIVGLIAVPLYLKYLGIEAYGLIGFFATMQALFQILDLGLAATTNREVARCSASGNLREAGNLLHTLAVIYWSTAGVIALAILGLAPILARYWLESKQLPQETMKEAVMLMGLTLACRWPIGLYQGVLVGAQRMTVSSRVNIAMVTLGTFGAVAVLAFVSSTIQAFFVWQAGVGLAHAIAMRREAWRAVGGVEDIQFRLDELKRVWRFSAGMGGIALSSLMFTQLDKILLSKVLTLEQFGHYMLATTVVSVLYVLITPVFNAVYPRFCALAVNDNTEALADFYRSGTRLLASVLFPIAIALAVFSEELMLAWIGDSNIASSVAPVVTLLAIGTALNGIMHYPYALQLAFGMTWLPLTINIALMIVMVPLTIFLALSYGARGGALAWLILEGLYLIFGTWLTHRHLLASLAPRWLFRDVGISLGMSFLVIAAGAWALQHWDLSIHTRLIYGAGLAVFASVLSWLASPSLRSLAWTHIKGPGTRSSPDKAV